MSRRTFVVSAAGAALATTFPGAGGAAPAAPALTARSVPPALGAEFHGMGKGYWQDGRPRPAFHRHLDTLRAYGVGVVRVEVAWSRSERGRGGPDPGHPYHQRLQALLDAVAGRRMKALVTLHGSPAWARAGATLQDPAARFPDDPGAVTPWAAWLAATYGDRVHAWEVWHEPNVPDTTGVTDPAERTARYVALLGACARGLRSARPSSVVVLGGPRHTDHRFVRDVYAAGARDHFDVLALRPGLGPGPEEEPAALGPGNFPAVAEVMRAYRDGGKPVWWTGFAPLAGDSAAPPAQPVVRAFDLARARHPQIRLGVLPTAHRPVLPHLAALRTYFAGYGGQRELL
ncbi:hypothetical protein ABZ951_22995 [Streptomyces sp. NPDC046215]|uniref:Uncharacterized protein n=1 Tax=Streptomyces stramineus TaxID=173861 RepID=A0ABN1AWZ7_9ACTN